MSLPVDIPRRSSLTSLSDSSSVSLGLYIPIHKRTPSSGSSRTSHGIFTSVSPCLFHCLMDVKGPGHPAVHSRIYSVDLLLSLRPTADESMRDKLRASCPEILMSRRIRKNLEFHERQWLHHDTPTTPRDQESQRIDVGIHRVPALPSQKQLHVPSIKLSSQTPKGRSLPRRNSRSAIRPAERRRQAWQPIQDGTWRSPQVV